MSGRLDDRLKAAARLLRPVPQGGVRFLLLHDPRTELADEATKPAGALLDPPNGPVEGSSFAASQPAARMVIAPVRADLRRLASLARGLNGSAADCLWAIQTCSKQELTLPPVGFEECWDQALIIAIVKAVLPDVYPDAEASRSVAALLTLRRDPRFSMMTPAWQVSALADLAWLASVDRPALTLPMLEPLKAIVSDIGLLRRSDTALVEFGGGPADPILTRALAALAFGGVNTAASVGRLGWETGQGECLLWLAPGTRQSPLMEIWHDGQPLLTTLPGASSATALLTDPPTPPRPLKVKRRDGGDTLTLEGACDGTIGRAACQWGRIVRLTPSRQHLEVEDWLLPSSPAPPILPQITGIQIVCGPGIAIDQLGRGRLSLHLPSGQSWLIDCPGLRWTSAPAPSAGQLNVLTAILPVAERPGTRSVKWSLSLQPAT